MIGLQAVISGFFLNIRQRNSSSCGMQLLAKQGRKLCWLRRRDALACGIHRRKMK
jgi:hypothetical protein